MFKRLKMLWLFSRYINKIVVFPNGRAEIFMEENAIIVADDFMVKTH